METKDETAVNRLESIDEKKDKLDMKNASSSNSDITHSKLGVSSSFSNASASNSSVSANYSSSSGALMDYEMTVR